MVTITLNGEKKILQQPITVQELVEELKLDVRKIAIERNLEIVSRPVYDQTALQDGDEVEIVHFIGGG